MTVPITALISAATSEAPSVSFSAASASGLVIASQKPARRSLVDSQMSAAIGSATTTVRKLVTKPRERAVDALSPANAARRDHRGWATLASGAADPALDAGQMPVFAGRRSASAPSSQPPRPSWSIVKIRAGRELLAVELGDALDHRPVAVLSRRSAVPAASAGSAGTCSPARCSLVFVTAIGSSIRSVAAGCGTGGRLLPGEQRLVLVREEDVALAAVERLQRRCARSCPARRRCGTASGRLRLLVGLALLPPRAVGGHDVPPRAARGERVRRDDLDARPEQVVPAEDLLRVAVPHDEHDDRVRDHALVLLLVPPRVDDPAATSSSTSGASESATMSALGRPPPRGSGRPRRRRTA